MPRKAACRNVAGSVAFTAGLMRPRLEQERSGGKNEEKGFLPRARVSGADLDPVAPALLGLLKRGLRPVRGFAQIGEGA